MSSGGAEGVLNQEAEDQVLLRQPLEGKWNLKFPVNRGQCNNQTFEINQRIMEV